MLSKLAIKREISLMHLLILLTSKLFIGISIGLMFSDFAFPYSYPLLLIGFLILGPALLKLFQEEVETDTSLEKKLKKHKKKS